jgi:hypothetical protein
VKSYQAISLIEQYEWIIELFITGTVMFDEKFFCDIPVYRLPEADYYAKRDTYIDQQMFGEKEEDRKIRKDFYKQNPDQESWCLNHLQKQYGGDWQFNEIIGYVRLYIDWSQVLGVYWQTDAKRIVKTRRKLFVWSTHKIAPERDLPLDGTNQEIYETILDYLDDVRAELKGRFIDTEVFETLGVYVDWHTFVRNT